MEKRKGLKRRLSILLIMAMVFTSLMPMWAYGGEVDQTVQQAGQLLTKENVEVKTTHSDGSDGGAVELEFDSATGTFSGNLANYTDLEGYNDADMTVTLKGLPEGATAQLKAASGEKIADFVDGTAKTTGKAVEKKGEYTFEIALQSGDKAESYKLKLTKTIGVKWLKLNFEAAPEFNSLIKYYGEPEGAIFQLDDEGNRTGKTGVAEDCFNYEVYLSCGIDSVKPAGDKGVKIFSNSFRYDSKYAATLYVDDETLMSNVPTCIAVCMKLGGMKDGINITKERTTLCVELKSKTDPNEIVKTNITFIRANEMDADTLRPVLTALEPEALTYPDDSNNVMRINMLYNSLSEEEKAKISNELKAKLDRAYELMRADRVPQKLEIAKAPAKLAYDAGQKFDSTGVELLATYADGTTRIITEGFTVEPAGELTNEKEVTFTYNTVSVKQPIRMVNFNLSGDGTEANPYKLATADDLQSLGDYVMTGKSTEGKYFEMTADITLPEGWKPIGVTIDGSNDIKKGANLYAFSGIIDGKDYTLTVPEGGLPLLGYVKGAEVKNLNIFGKKIAGYGLVNNLEGVGLSGTSIIIDNVTLKSGSSTLKSGLLGANITTNGFAGCSAGFAATVRNCTIEEGVVIGYNKDQKMIGSIAGRMQGTVENCKSYATVYGTNYVGGIIGTRDNAVGVASVTGCEFGGTVEASGEHAGGIIGGAYSNSTAPNGGRIYVKDCSSSGKITGKDKVGGILGGDSFVVQSWGQTTFKKNSFTGTVKATDGKYVGGVVGYLGSLNKYDGFAANYYSSKCGTDKGIGFVQYVDTSYEDHETESGATYINTANGTPGIDGIVKTNHNRTDDPLGKDAKMLTYSDADKDPIAIELAVSGEYKTSYLVGEDLDLSGMNLTVSYHTGETKEITSDEVEVKGYDKNKRGTQEVSLVYGAVSAIIEVTVLKPATGDITVSVSVLGDTKHGADASKVHTLAAGNLTPWVDKQTIEIDTNATVLDAIEKAIEGKGITLENPSGNYIKSVTKDGTKLGETDNGANSGWMYTLNGAHTDLGVAEQYLEEGDEIVLHYTDDYTKENWDSGKTAAEVIKLIDTLPAVDKLTLADSAAVMEASGAFNALSDEDKALISQMKQDKLNQAVLKIAELRNEALESFEDAHKTTGSVLAGLLKGNEVFGAEWPVIGLARAGEASAFDADAYYNSVADTVKANGSAKLSSSKSTENARVILALTSIGKDVTDVSGYNLIEPLADLDYLKKQGINGPIWALIALDSHDYEIPTVVDGGTQATRENIIDTILAMQLADGGFALSGNTADADMTAMAIQALAPYYDSNAEVKTAVDKALDCLSAMQGADGGYASWGTVNSESCAQVLTALTALGIDPAEDARFIKNGNTVIDALLGFYVEGGGFSHVAGGDLNGMATEQGYYALTSYARMLAGKTALYDMSDVEIGKAETANPADPTNPANPSDSNKPAGTTPAKTGDDANAVPWAMAALAAGAGILIFRKRKAA